MLLARNTADLMSDVITYDKIFINGEWVKPHDGGTIDSIDPSTGQVWAHVAYGGPDDIDRAVAAAREAFEGPWGRMPGHERAAIMRKFADLYQASAPDMAILETRDSGRAIRESRADLGAHHNWIQWYASLTDKLGGRTIPFDDTVHMYTTRVPVGVVGAITPWNAPMLTTIWKIAPALAAGCTVVLKPAEQTPVTALELARITEEAGFPPGVFNVVPGYGANAAGARLVEHPDVNKIAFTGEGSTAQTLLRNSGNNFKRFTFELGGKAPNIIFGDADLEPALNAATNSAWTLCGQSCTLGSRVLVERSVYDQVVDEFSKRAAKVRVGKPLDDATHMGPQAHQEQLEKTLSYIGIGQDEGAELVAGGNRLESGDLANGYFVAPTVFANVANDMRIAQEEIFGPVASLIPFDGEEEAISIANGTPYGLTAGLWTRDVGRAHRVSSRINAGTVWVNTFRFIRWPMPYGGFGASGWGREGGTEGLDGYLETRTSVISTTGQYPDAYEQ